MKKKKKVNPGSFAPDPCTWQFRSFESDLVHMQFFET